MPTDRPTRGSADNRGSSPVGAAPSRNRGNLIALILGGVVALALIVLLLSRCGTSGDSTTGSVADSSDTSAAASSGASTSSASASTSAAPGTTTSSPAGSAAGDAGAVTAGTQSVLAAAASADPAAALAALSGQGVTATAVQVLSVPADEGFWVGTSDADRIWVQLTGDGESGYQVVQGDTVDFTGTLVAHEPTFAGTVGVDEAEGAAQLDAQAQHVEVPEDAVTLTTS